MKKLEGGWGGWRSASPPDASLTTMMEATLKRSWGGGLGARCGDTGALQL